MKLKYVQAPKSKLGTLNSMSMESALSSIKYLQRWFKSNESIALDTITDLNYQGEVKEELIGWKVAYIANWQKGLFKGVSFGEYGIQGRYNCIRKDCIFGSCKRCGFYSYIDSSAARKFLQERFGTVLLQVTHYGTIFVHKKGFRSEEQEVLSVEVNFKCSRFLCMKKSMGLRKTGALFGASCLRHHVAGTDFANLSKLWQIPVEVSK